VHAAGLWDTPPRKQRGRPGAWLPGLRGVSEELRGAADCTPDPAHGTRLPRGGLPGMRRWSSPRRAAGLGH